MFNIFRESNYLRCANPVCGTKLLIFQRRCHECNVEVAFSQFYYEYFDPYLAALRQWQQQKKCVRRVLTYDD